MEFISDRNVYLRDEDTSCFARVSGATYRYENTECWLLYEPNPNRRDFYDEVVAHSESKGRDLYIDTIYTENITGNFLAVAGPLSEQKLIIGEPQSGEFFVEDLQILKNILGSNEIMIQNAVWDNNGQFIALSISENEEDSQSMHLGIVYLNEDEVNYAVIRAGKNEKLVPMAVYQEIVEGIPSDLLLIERHSANGDTSLEFLLVNSLNVGNDVDQTPLANV